MVRIHANMVRSTVAGELAGMLLEQYQIPHLEAQPKDKKHWE